MLESVLNKCINFTTTIRHVSYIDIIAPVEEVDLKVLKAQANEKVRQALEKAKLLKSNITREERSAVKTLESDKSNDMVMIDKLEYP